MIQSTNPDLCVAFDLETLSTNPNGGVVLSLGLCVFHLSQKNEFDDLLNQSMEMLFDKQQQLDKGRHVDPATEGWWSQQGETAQRVLNPEPGTTVDCTDLHVMLSRFYQNLGINKTSIKETRWFSRGHFDASFIEDFCRTFEMDAPYKYWCWRDSRTYLDAKGLGPLNQKMEKPPQMVAHNAKHDAAFEAYMLQRLT